MKWISKQSFLQQCTQTLEEGYETLSELPELLLSSLKPTKSALIMVDMINGFARDGALQSPRVAALVPGIVELAKACQRAGHAKVAFADSHSEAAPEFESYPVHCLVGTVEEELVDELRELGGYTLIVKNSTNGFLEPAFQTWLLENQQIDTFIVVGDCTDICISQFAITLKTWYNRQNQKSRVIVPIELVDTYDLGVHNAELMNAVALLNMMGNGIEVVKQIVVPETTEF